VKRLSADDSAGSRVKVGHCQANIKQNAQPPWLGVFAFGRRYESSRFLCAVFDEASHWHGVSRTIAA
ncbi:hypothetical protein, partial [Methylibium petroleiphilum]